jgi:hypothetical protein
MILSPEADRLAMALAGMGEGELIRRGGREGDSERVEGVCAMVVALAFQRSAVQ